MHSPSIKNQIMGKYLSSTVARIQAVASLHSGINLGY
jgi:hypothetical protein